MDHGCPFWCLDLFIFHLSFQLCKFYLLVCKPLFSNIWTVSIDSVILTFSFQMVVKLQETSQTEELSMHVWKCPFSNLSYPQPNVIKLTILTWLIMLINSKLRSWTNFDHVDSHFYHSPVMSLYNLIWYACGCIICVPCTHSPFINNLYYSCYCHDCFLIFIWFCFT